MTRLQVITGLRDSEFKLKLLETPRANDNSTVEEMLWLIQYRNQSKRFAESLVYQSTSSVVSYAEKRGPKNKNKLSRRQKPEHCGGCARSHSLYFLSALLRMKCVTIGQNKDKLKNKKLRELRRKRIRKQMHQCTRLVKNNNPSWSEETMFYAEQIATVEDVHHTGSKAEFHSIKLNCHGARMQNHIGSSVIIISTSVWRTIGIQNWALDPDWLKRTMDTERKILFI